MSAAKHTPAPWWVTDSGVRDSGGYICHTNRATHYPGQDERYESETAERAANARLIAAAPDYFAGAESLLAWADVLDAVAKAEGFGGGSITAKEIRTALQAAHAKALGAAS